LEKFVGLFEWLGLPNRESETKGWELVKPGHFLGQNQLENFGDLSVLKRFSSPIHFPPFLK